MLMQLIHLAHSRLENKIEMRHDDVIHPIKSSEHVVMSSDFQCGQKMRSSFVVGVSNEPMMHFERAFFFFKSEIHTNFIDRINPDSVV